ncbi:hypothetical protein C5E16_10030 [Clavibacter michiganensis]|uniref:Integral membrane protein n=1 Tax=Clavibacter michiganensis TaxID=28447 RepID=A0A2S5VSR7_9MICO|nr:hypothetical protein [Clavibacter michiganensis]PPF67022.1 hypothetical protein C5E16_10030 [Clavibacter michiganensis]
MRSKLLWPTAAVAATMVGALIPMLFFRRYYFVNDTEAGAFGQWWEIGDRLLSGNWSLLNTTVWQSGNYQAEGAWGIYSPFIWVIGLGSHVLFDAALYATIVKLVCLAIGSVGFHVLARSYGIPRAWAAAVAVAAPLAGFTLYYDAPSWVNGLMAWCWWPLAVGLTRRSVLLNRTPYGGIAASLLLVGIGYVSTTLMLAASLAAILLEAVLRRDRGAIWRALAASTIAGLFTIVVHLPGLLTASVSGRNEGVVNTGFLGVDLTDLAISGIPTGGPFMETYGGQFPGSPLTYITWLLPLVVLIRPRELARLLRSRPSLVIIAIVAVIAVSAPSQIGPLRFPVRVLPYVAGSVLLILALGLSRARRTLVTRRHLLAASLIVLGTGGLMVLQAPREWRAIVVGMIVSAVLVTIAMGVAGAQLGRAGALPGVRGIVRSRDAAGVTRRLAVVAVAGTLFALVPQHAFSPASPLSSYWLPSDVVEYSTQLPGSRGDVLVVGWSNDSFYDESLVGNSWYVTGKPVQNAYSSVYYPGYSSAVCMQYNGFTCGQLYEQLFEPVEGSDTGTDLVDLLGVSTVQVVKIQRGLDSSRAVPSAQWKVVPAGWHVAQDTPHTRLIVRDEPVGGAGGIAWSSEGTVATVVRSDPMGTTFRLDSVPADGGRVALSLIPWPGYQIDRGELTRDPVDGMLLGVDVSPEDEGQTVTVSFWSPGWQVQLGCGILAVLLVAAWALLRRRARRDA